MQTYAVHLYTQVRVKVTGIQAEAMEKAEGQVDLHDLLDNKEIRVSKYDLGGGVEVEAAEWAEGQTDLYLVDTLLENGEVANKGTCFFGPDGLPLVDDLTTVERKAKNADLADKFMQELLDSVETLTGIADEHGSRTLADLMYLQLAILKGSFIDHYPDESKVLDIARDLPSGEQWAKFIKVEYMESFAETSVAALREDGVTDYCNQVCGGGNCGGDGLCQYGIDSKTHMPPETLRHWAVTGRIPGDHEDTLHVFHVATRQEALDAFDHAIWENEKDAEAGRDNVFKEHGQTVFVNSIVVSDSPIQEA